MPDVAAPWIVLNQPCIRPLISKDEAASVAELVCVEGQGKPGRLPVVADRKPCGLAAERPEPERFASRLIKPDRYGGKLYWQVNKDSALLMEI